MTWRVDRSEERKGWPGGKLCVQLDQPKVQKKKKIRKPGHALAQLSKMQRKFFGLFQKFTEHFYAGRVAYR